MTDSEINEAVARQLGNPPCSDGYSQLVNKDGSRICQHCGASVSLERPEHIEQRDYCHRIDAAWDVVDHLRDRGVSVDLMVTPKLSRCTIREMAMGLIQTSAEAGPTDASRAICLAFLKLT